MEVFRRQEEGWVLREAGPGETIALASVDVTLDIDELYRDPLAGA